MAKPPLPPELAAFLRDELGQAEMLPASFTVSGPVWLWQGGGKEGEPAKGSWYFLTIGGTDADAIRTAASGRTGGWGSVKIEAELGGTRWTTSLFPSKELGGYFLPLKAGVRKAERIGEGDEINVVVRLV